MYITMHAAECVMIRISCRACLHFCDSIIHNSRSITAGPWSCLHVGDSYREVLHWGALLMWRELEFLPSRWPVTKKILWEIFPKCIIHLRIKNVLNEILLISLRCRMGGPFDLKVFAFNYLSTPVCVARKCLALLRKSLRDPHIFKYK